MADWDGKERRVESVQLKHLTETIEHHIKSDDMKFDLLFEKMNNTTLELSKLVVLNTETLKSQMLLVSNTQQMVMKHNEFLFGNGTNGEKSISVRIDRLEGYEESRKWTFRVMWGAIITLFTKIFYDFVSRK